MGIVDRSLRYYNVTKSIISFDKKGNSRIPPPSYKGLHLHPRNYYKTYQLKESENSERNVQTKNEAEKIPILGKSQMTPRKFMSDEQILEKYIDLSASYLSSQEKDTWMNMVKLHKEAFSLRDEISKCSNIKIDIEVVDDSTFFLLDHFLYMKKINPSWIDIYIAKIVSLGILSKNNTTHTSPVMLIGRQGSKNKIPIVDFRLLNTRMMKRSIATPLLKDIFKC